MDPNRRKIKYNLVSDLCQDLLNEIYGNREAFINATEEHPLEPYIISFDENMENEDIVISLGERIGFGIELDETDAYTPAEQFYDRCSFTIRYNTLENIKKIMNMTMEDYTTFMESKGLKANDDMYYDRLNIDSHKYNMTMLRRYLNLLDIQESTVEQTLSFVDEGIVAPGVTIEK